MHIVKLGGSLYHTAELKSWLTLLEQTALNECVVIVPGGGPFADMVRQAQQLHKFDDQHAHHMAILAMAQYGLMLQALLPSAVLVKTPAEVSSHCQLAIWVPDDQLLQVEEITQNWQITSDSLALWFAQQFPQSSLSLIKRVSADSGDLNVLSKKGIIDQGFTALFQQRPILTQLIHYQAPDNFPERGIKLG